MSCPYDTFLLLFSPIDAYDGYPVIRPQLNILDIGTDCTLSLSYKTISADIYQNIRQGWKQN